MMADNYRDIYIFVIIIRLLDFQYTHIRYSHIRAT